MSCISHNCIKILGYEEYHNMRVIHLGFKILNDVCPFCINVYLKNTAPRVNMKPLLWTADYVETKFTPLQGKMNFMK
jgi:hypothetical protein